MNIKVAAFTVSEKSINTSLSIRLQLKGANKMVGSVLHTQIRHNLPAMTIRNLILGAQTRDHQKPYDHLKHFTLTITVKAF